MFFADSVLVAIGFSKLLVCVDNLFVMFVVLQQNKFTLYVQYCSISIANWTYFGLNNFEIRMAEL